MSDFVRAALRYTALGLKVLPVRRDKRPATAHGVKDATIDEGQIRSWFGLGTDERGEAIAPAYDLAVTGGFFVDVDPRNGGIQSEQRLLKIVPELADAPIVETGGGGRHYWFAPIDVKNAKLTAFPGIDFKSSGGYVIAPPSRHASGKRYKWIVEPTDRLTTVSKKLLALFKKQAETAPAAKVAPDGRKIREGHRNKDLFRYCSILRGRGLNAAEIISLATARNRSKYDPPLDGEEVLRTAQSAAKQGTHAPEITSSWRAKLLLTQKGYIASCIHNGILALENDPSVKLRWNEVTKAIEVDGVLAQYHGETLHIETAAWLHSEYQIDLTSHQAGECLASVAKRHLYDPVKTYLRSVTWDGQERLAQAAKTYLGTNEPFAALALRKWLLSAVARALRPGCQTDHVLVLEGKQGAGKSSVARILGGKWACDTELDLGDKDSRLLAASSWIVELAEIASLKRSELDRQKAFLSAVTDKFRPPYGAKVEEYPRRCVFIGSTNEEGDYLIDPTGNRRFWPIRVGTINIEALKQDRDQLWAEAVAAFDNNEIWWLEDAADIAAAQEAVDDRTREQPLAVLIEDWYLKKNPFAAPNELGARPDSSRTIDIARGLGLDLSNERYALLIGKALRQLGCYRKQHRTDVGREWRYHWPERMRLAAQRVVAKAKTRAPSAPAKVIPISRSRTSPKA